MVQNNYNEGVFQIVQILISMPSDLSLLYLREASTGQYEADLASWEYHYKLLMAKIEGSPTEKQMTIRKRIMRYFGQFKLEEDIYFSTRIQGSFTSPHVQVISNQLVLYGVDYYSISRATLYFQGISTEITRIDDSHFLVVFKNEKDCLKALSMKSLDKIQFSSPAQVLKSTNDKGWIKILPYYEFLFERKLMARFKTNFDHFDPNGFQRRGSVVHAYNEAKTKFMTSLQSQMDKRSELLRPRESQQRERQRRSSYSQEKYYSRSRDKNNQAFFYANKKHNYYPSRQDRGYSTNNCQCFKNCGFQRNIHHESPRYSYQPQHFYTNPTHGYKGRQEKYGVVNDFKINEVNEKFQMYIKNRDLLKNKGGAVKKEKDRQIIGELDHKKLQQEFLNGSQLLLQENEGKKNSKSSSSEDFQKFLERLKIGDSKDFSLFEVETSQF